MPLSYLNVDVINPSTVNTVTVNNIDIVGTTGFIAQRSLAIGLNAGYSNTGSLAIGTNALQNATSFNNTAIGNLTLQSASSNCTALGYGAGSGTTGGSGTFVGYNAGALTTTGYANTIVGAEAGQQVTTGNSNVFVGYRAGVGNSGGSITTGSNNVFIGTNGFDASATTSNTIILGNASTTTLACQVTSITSLSDGRDKKNIETLPIGLEFINELNPVKFVWNDRDEQGKHNIKDCGFIAQDLKSIQEKYNIAEELQLVNEEITEGKMYASYGRLVPVLVQAIKDLSAKVEQLENK